MDPSHVIPQEVFTDEQLYLQSLRHCQHQSTPPHPCVEPFQSEATVYPYLTQATMPTHTCSTPGMQAGQPQAQNLLAEGVWPRHHPTSTSDQIQKMHTFRPRVDVPGAYPQVIPQPNEVLRQSSSPSLNQGFIYNNEHKETPSAQGVPSSSLQPTGGELYALGPQNVGAVFGQGLPTCKPQAFHQRLHCRSVPMPGCTGIDTVVHRQQREQIEGRQCSSVAFTPGASSNDISFIRKLRQRERNPRATCMRKKRECVHGKRSQLSLEQDGDNLPPAKQFISEDKMAAKMSNLSLTGDNKMTTLEERWQKASRDAKRHLADIESRLSDCESDIESDTDCQEPGRHNGDYNRIEVSPELKTVLSQQKGPLPDTVLKSMSGNCTQLVLWKPLSSYIDTIMLSANPDDIEKTASVLPESTTVKMEGGNVRDTHCNITRPVAWTDSTDAVNATQLFDSVDDDMDL